MVVFQTDADGFFVGEVTADPDPKEEGNWLIPGGAVTVQPPPLAGGERARWTGEGWEVVPPEPGPEPEPEPTPEDLLEQEREAMIASRFQAKAALLGAGLLDDVEALIANSDDRFLQIAWNEAIEYRRTSPTILAMAQALSLTDEQVDDLFRLAMTIEA